MASKTRKASPRKRAPMVAGLSQREAEAELALVLGRPVVEGRPAKRVRLATSKAKGRERGVPDVAPPAEAAVGDDGATPAEADDGDEDPEDDYDPRNHDELDRVPIMLQAFELGRRSKNKLPYPLEDPDFFREFVLPLFGKVEPAGCGVRWAADVCQRDRLARIAKRVDRLEAIVERVLATVDKADAVIEKTLEQATTEDKGPKRSPFVLARRTYNQLLLKVDREAGAWRHCAQWRLSRELMLWRAAKRVEEAVTLTDTAALPARNGVSGRELAATPDVNFK